MVDLPSIPPPRLCPACVYSTLTVKRQAFNVKRTSTSHALCQHHRLAPSAIE